MPLLRGTRLAFAGGGSSAAPLVDTVDFSVGGSRNALFWAGEEEMTDATTKGYYTAEWFPAGGCDLPNGGVIAVAEARDKLVTSASSDASCMAIRIKLSSDYGATYGQVTTVWQEPSYTVDVTHLNFYGIGYDPVIDVVFLLWTRRYTLGEDTAYRALVAAKSIDRGRTWTQLHASDQRIPGAALSGSLGGTDITFTDATHATIVVGDQPTGHVMTNGRASALAGTITGAADNGSGKVRITTGAAHNLATGEKVRIAAITGTTEANGDRLITVIDGTHFDLPNVAFSNAYIGGGTWKCMWRWHAGRGAHGTYTNGGLRFGGHHRFTADTSGTPHFHVIGTNDHGTTWTVIGGRDQGVANDDNMIEPSLCLRANGSLYAMLRHSTNVKYFYTSTDNGATWGTRTALTGMDGPATAVGLNRIGSVIVACYPTDITNTNRVHCVLAYSTDDGLTFAERTVFYGWNAYADVLAPNSQTALLIFSSGDQSRDVVLGAGKIKFGQQVSQIRVSLPYAMSTTDADNYTDFQFAESGTGLTTGAYGRMTLPGASIRDSGPQQHAMLGLQDADAIPQNAYPTYWRGLTEDGLGFTNTQSITMAEAGTHYALVPFSGESFTWEFRFLAAAGGAKAVLFANKESGSVAGVELHISTTAKAVAVIFDGTNTNTVTSTSDVDDGGTTAFTVMLVRDIANAKWQLWVNGTMEAETALTATGALFNASTDMVMNRYPGGTAAGASLKAIRFRTYRKAKGASHPFLTSTTPKTVPSRTELGYNFPPRQIQNTLPYQISNAGQHLKLWIDSTWDKGYFSRAGSMEGAGQPPKVFHGYNAHAFHDLSLAGHFLRGNYGDGSSHAIRYEEDATLGGMWNHVKLATGASNWQAYNTQGSQAKNFDFLHKTGVAALGQFVIVMAVKLNSTGISHYWMDNCGDGSTSGTTLAWLTDNTLYFRQFNTTATIAITATTHWSPSMSAFTTGTRYFLALIGNGVGNAITAYRSPLTVGGTIGSPFTSTSTVAAGTDAASTSNMFFGCRNDGNGPVDLSDKDVMIFDTNVLTDGASLNTNALCLQAMYDKMVSNYSHLGI